MVTKRPKTRTWRTRKATSRRVKPYAVLTLKQLVTQQACQSQRDLFRERFGPSVVVSPENCRMHAPYFQWDWAAGALLSWRADSRYYEMVRPSQQRYSRYFYWASSRMSNEVNRARRAGATSEQLDAIERKWQTRITARRIARDEVRAAAFCKLYNDGRSRRKS